MARKQKSKVATNTVPTPVRRMSRATIDLRLRNGTQTLSNIKIAVERHPARAAEVLRAWLNQRQ